MAICKICKVEVPRGGKTTKSITTTNLVHHLKAKDVEDYTKYNKLKGLNSKRKVIQVKLHSLNRFFWQMQPRVLHTSRLYVISPWSVQF